MNRRQFLGQSAAAWVAGSGLAMSGCRGQHAHVLTGDKADMVGSHGAGAETYKPLVDEAVGKLLGRHAHGVQQAGMQPMSAKRICFVGVENKSVEELGDFKAQITEIIDSKIVQAGVFQPISRRFVEAGLRQARIRSDDLFLPAHQRNFLAVMEQMGHPFDYLLFASLTSGTTRNNSDMQRDYLLTLELVSIHDGTPDKESATLRKGYHKSRVGMWRNY